MSDRLRPRKVRLLAATTIATIVGLSGCGGTPTKAEFVAKTRETIGTDLASGLKTTKIPTEVADRLIDQLLGCQYDAIKGDADLLEKAYDDPGDVTIAPELDSRSITCTTKFSEAMADAAKAEQ